ncbi:LacI family DNA-binding transcriptional regulator [Virgibacillus sp. MG-45]|uniref:LacI family DNA-binding transcriptional regulator n=1 Tax=Virgibacillus sp. MG-45 TaxID=3102791 RepID=UPI002ED8DB46
MKITIKDIAKKANVSPSAVSLVLNNRPCRISNEKRKKIKEIAEEYNYSANQIARSLVTKKTQTLGLIIPDIENIFFSSLAKNIEAYCREKGYMLMIVNSNNEYDNDLELINLLASRSVEGMFIIPSDSSYSDNTEIINRLEKLSKASIPYVLIDRIYPELSCDKITYDNELGAYLAVRHLLENGHRKIACIASSEMSYNGNLRLRGYYKAMKEFNSTIKPGYVLQGDYRIDSGYEAGNQILDKDITAVFITNDMMTLGFLKSVYENGKRVPDDFSVVGYDNSIYPYVFGVELTSIEQDVEQLGKHAVQLLFSKLQDPNKSYESLCLSPRLVVKNSVKEI